MTPHRFRRRTLLAAAMGAAAAYCGLRRWPRTDYETLAAFCAGPLGHRQIGLACLGGLPAVHRSANCLARLLLRDLAAAGSDRMSAEWLPRAIRDRSRADFRDDRIVGVDGWMLSLTEVRVYALAALLPGEPENFQPTAS